jgi:hypothetical protein
VLGVLVNSGVAGGLESTRIDFVAYPHPPTVFVQITDGVKVPNVA